MKAFEKMKGLMDCKHIDFDNQQLRNDVERNSALEFINIWSNQRKHEQV